MEGYKFVRCWRSHSLDNRLIDGGEVISLKHRPRSTLLKRFPSASATRFCCRLGKPRGLERLKGLGKLTKSMHLIGPRTSDCPARSIVSQPTTLPRAVQSVESQQKFRRNILPPSSGSKNKGNKLQCKQNLK
jgi:hypothetical protein